MRFFAFREHRLQELQHMARCLGGESTISPGLNHIKGLCEMVQDTRPKSVLEIGSCRGVSTEVFLLFCNRVVAFDSWEGNWEKHLADFVDMTNGYPNLEIFKGKSPVHLNIFKDGEFEMVYIDADHDYDSVRADINAATRLTSRWLAGHDCLPSSEVERAVMEIGKPYKVFDDTSWLIELIEQK